MDKNVLMIIAGVGMVVVEMLLGASTGFDLLIIGISFVLGGLVGTWTQSITLGLLTASMLSIVYLLFGRSFVKSKITVNTNKTNTEKLLGAEAVVLKAITKSKPGQIKVDGEVWRAESTKSIKPGQKVLIKSISGVSLKVE